MLVLPTDAVLTLMGQVVKLEAVGVIQPAVHLETAVTMRAVIKVTSYKHKIACIHDCLILAIAITNYINAHVQIQLTAEELAWIISAVIIR